MLRNGGWTWSPCVIKPNCWALRAPSIICFGYFRCQKWFRVLPLDRKTPVEHTLRSFHYGLHGTTFSYPIKNLQFWNDDLSYQCVRLNCQHFTVRVLLEDFNTRPMDQKCIVQDEKIIIENAQRVTLKRKLNWVNDAFFREIVLKRMCFNEYFMNIFFFSFYIKQVT